MNELSPRLKGFARRVRIVRSWRGLAIGACTGAAASAVWAGLDWANIAYTDWTSMGFLVGGGAVLGAVINALRPVPAHALTVSIDRRAGLEDRLATADERSSGNDAFDDALRQDAEARLAAVQPKTVYPIRVDRWHGGTVALTAAAAAIFLLGNTPLLLNDAAKAGREEVKKEGQKIERIRKEVLETPEAKQEMDEAQRKLLEEMRRLEKEMEKARMTPEEARQKSNELAKKAEELAQQDAKKTQQSLNEAKTALDQMLKQELQKAGMPEADPQLAQLSDAEREQAMQDAKREQAQAQKDIDQLQNQLSALQQKLADPKLSEEERKALEAQKKATEEALKKAQEAKKTAEAKQKALELSKEAKAVFQKMAQHKLMDEIRELAKKLAEAAKQGQQNPSKPPLTDAERKEMQKKLEELAKQLKDDKAMEEYLKKMLEAMKNAKSMCQNGQCAGGLGLGLSLPIPGGPGPDDDQMLFDTGRVNKLDKEEKGAGKTTPTSVTGERREGTGEEAYIEIKAPTTVGNRSSVPYVKVLPSYKKKAESALDRQQIPKEHEKRVREYFNSLGK
jgi:chemotaxis protein histidine kinase CheA